MKENNYYNKKVEELYKELNTNISGLTEEEASKRLEEYGENKLAERKKKSNFIIFLNQFNDLMIILLIFASVFSSVISILSFLILFDSPVRVDSFTSKASDDIILASADT
jgi:P-type Ca2+ transporter type 2C